MDLGNADSWGEAIYFWIMPVVLGDAIFPPVPSEMVVIAGGALSADGRANVFLVGALAALASWLGDILVFQLFKRRLGHVLDRWGWGRKFHRGIHAAIARAGRSSTYGGIVGIRFLPGGRLATSAAAGIADVSTPAFNFCAALGAVLWASWLVGLGYFTGSATRLPFWASSLIGVGVGLVVGSVLAMIVTRNRARRARAGRPDGKPAAP